MSFIVESHRQMIPKVSNALSSSARSSILAASAGRPRPLASASSQLSGSSKRRAPKATCADLLVPYEAVLQLCRSGLICWANAPYVIGFRSVQVEAIRTGSHPSGGWLVSAFFLVVTGTLRSCSPSEVCTPITSRCGVGFKLDEHVS